MSAAPLPQIATMPRAVRSAAHVSSGGNGISAVLPALPPSPPPDVVSAVELEAAPADPPLVAVSVVPVTWSPDEVSVVPPPLVDEAVPPDDALESVVDVLVS